MGAAAGAGVRPGEGDDAHPSGEGLLAAVRQDLQLLGRGEGDLDGVVLPDVAVGRLLQFPDLLLGEFYAEVDGDHVAPHVKAHVFTAIAGVGDPGDDVLPGVVLHQIEAAGPVDVPLNLGAGLQRAVAGVDYMALPLVDLQNEGPAQGAQVIGLSASLGIEGRLIQYDVPALPALDTALDTGGEVGEIGVQLK